MKHLEITVCCWSQVTTVLWKNLPSSCLGHSGELTLPFSCSQDGGVCKGWFAKVSEAVRCHGGICNSETEHSIGVFMLLFVSSNNDLKTSVNKGINSATRNESWLLVCMMELLNSYVWDLKQQLVNIFDFSLFVVLWRYILYKKK